MTLTTFSTSPEAQQAAALIEGYRFDLAGHEARQWVSLWLELYRPSWIRDAVVEALYQGRYKAFSVRQILELWEKRGKPIRHAPHDFETSVCREYGEPVNLAANSSPRAPLRTVLPAAGEPIKQRASRRIHQSLSSISFNLAELSAYSAGRGDVAEVDAASQPVNARPMETSSDEVQSVKPQSAETQPIDRYPSTSESLHGKAIGDRPEVVYQSSARSISKAALIETAETLLAQRQRGGGGVLYSSARAIQPFKPALPFSAQTLRLAKQKALAIADSK